MVDGHTTKLQWKGLKGRVRSLVWVGALFYLAAVILGALGLHFLGDRWWPATLVLFGPRWLMAIPLACLVPAALVLCPRALVPSAVAALIVVGPILGFEVPVSQLFRDERAGQLRIVSFNARSRHGDLEALRRFVEVNRPDLVALQECGWQEQELQSTFPGWEVRTNQGQCLLSKFPVREVVARDRMDVWKRGGNGAIVRYDLELPGDGGLPRHISVVNVHLETVRDAIEALMHRAWRGATEHDDNVELRTWESSLARQWVDASPGPVIVAGDFNMPVESAIYRSFWSDMQNAFSRAGFGTGTTKQTRWFGIRIDHVLTNADWSVERAQVGPDLGSDHRPVIADLRWIGQK
ncbi:endonuclease/exonuclease/phosphatase family protein [Chondromyces crocatus]|uniref:Endonuclease/exonuclease/phosphatase n=1 Tax=Chondromyces crocatus TaxID=52 RepID=A0A0K1EG76_CHOCO|nr:endonuclease/exonuclease/phosphatase family protein [Chondromyces crocatus]AKT39692.1 endonuclease/exonuclease/phosphatase [Chondromyces crocatus]